MPTPHVRVLPLILLIWLAVACGGHASATPSAAEISATARAAGFRVASVNRVLPLLFCASRKIEDQTRFEVQLRLRPPGVVSPTTGLSPGASVYELPTAGLAKHCADWSRRAEASGEPLSATAAHRPSEPFGRISIYMPAYDGGPPIWSAVTRAGSSLLLGTTYSRPDAIRLERQLLALAATLRNG